MTWRYIHDFLIKRHLQRQKCLRQSLPSGPPKNGNRRQNLTRWRIRRQTSALSSGMKQQVFFIFRQRKTSSLVLHPLLTPLVIQIVFHQPNGATARSELLSYGVIGTKPLCITEIGRAHV